MTPDELVPPNTPYYAALEAFTEWKLLVRGFFCVFWALTRLARKGDRLGFRWVVDRARMAAAERDMVRPFALPVVHIWMRSWRPSDRWVELDFARHELRIAERPWTLDEATFRERWAVHLAAQAPGRTLDEARHMVTALEQRALAHAPQSAAVALEHAHRSGRSAYLALHDLGEKDRTVPMPGAWLTRFKHIDWPRVDASEFSGRVILKQ